MTYLSSWSKRQWFWFAGTLAVVAVILSVGLLFQPSGNAIPASSFTTDKSLRDIAPELEVTSQALARELGLPIDTPKGKPLKTLGVTQEGLDQATAHLESHRPTQFRYYIFVALVLWGFVFLWRLGRPDGSPVTQRRSWYPRAPYIVALVVAGVLCGFAMGKSPNPMEGIVKVFKSMVGLYPSVADKVIGLIFFLALAVIGNKLICGWACPFGALQELLYSFPILNRIKRRKVPFKVSNTIRTLLFAISLLLLFGVVGGEKGFVLYHSMNAFTLFDLDFSNAAIVITILVALGGSLFVYRPFCQFVCPFGLISWFAERFSLARVRINPTLCNECGMCIRACPVEAAKGRVAGKVFAADCYSCARCLNVCAQDAITYGITGRSAAKMD